MNHRSASLAWTRPRRCSHIHRICFRRRRCLSHLLPAGKPRFCLGQAPLLSSLLPCMLSLLSFLVSSSGEKRVTAQAAWIHPVPANLPMSCFSPNRVHSSSRLDHLLRASARLAARLERNPNLCRSRNFCILFPLEGSRFVLLLRLLFFLCLIDI